MFEYEAATGTLALEIGRLYVIVQSTVSFAKLESARFVRLLTGGTNSA